MIELIIGTLASIAVVFLMAFAHFLVFGGDDDL